MALPPKEKIEIIDRIKPTVPPEWYIPYEHTLTGVPPMASFGDGYRYHITGLVHDEKGFPTSRPDEVLQGLSRLFEKIEKGFGEICEVRYYKMEDAEYCIVAYGSVVLSAKSAIEILREEGIKAGLLELVTLWPFPRFAFERVLNMGIKGFLVPEMNMGQVYREVVRVTEREVPIKKFNKIIGELITPYEIVKEIKKF